MEPRSGFEERTVPGDAEEFGPRELLLASLGALLAIPAVFIEAFDMPLFLGPVVAGPLIEEIAKPMGLVILLTRRPELRLPPAVGLVAGAFSGFVFAALENAIYLNIYHPEHTEEYVVYRWTVCVALHIICSSLVGYGLALGRAGRRDRDRASDPDGLHLLASSAPHLLDEPRERADLYHGVGIAFLTLAVVLHGAYNLTAILFSEHLPH